MRLKLASLFLILVLAACSIPPGTGTAQPTPPPPTKKADSTRTPTAVTPLAILVVSAGMNAEESQLYQTTVYELAQSSGYRFQVRNTFTTADLTEPGLQIVVALPPDPGLAALAAAAPQIHFLAVNIPNIDAGANLSVIGSADRPDYAAFLGGYVAAMTSDDYRVGLLIQKDTDQAKAIEIAFKNGVTFYCGLCQHSFSYGNYTYPLVVQIPIDAKENELPFYAEYLTKHLASVIYVQEEVETEEVLNRVTGAGVQMLGTKTPADPALADFWVVTIQPDFISALRAAWPDLVAGRAGKLIPSPIQLTNINADILTPGKQRLVRETLDQLVTGFIDTGVNP